MNWTHYIGVDPGFEGGIAVINRSGTTARAWPMPVSRAKGDKDSQREIDLHGLHTVFKQLRLLPAPMMAMEWPTTRPGEGAERCERFGRGKGYLEAFAFLLNFHYDKIAPNKWKGRLGLPGKFDDPGSKQGQAFLGVHYPQHAAIVLGPRGGLHDGLLDALLIAHYIRQGDVSPVGWKGGPKPALFR